MKNVSEREREERDWKDLNLRRFRGENWHEDERTTERRGGGEVRLIWE